MTESNKIELYFDGDCPLCVREIHFLKWMDSGKNVEFIDISATDFDGAHGKSYETLMGRMHARTPDGDWIAGVEVFERVYGAVGLGAISFILRLPGVHSIARRAYNWFAANRLRLTGRCDSQDCQIHA